MKTPFAARAAALGLSFALTLVMLASMDHLATLEPSASAVMAAASQPRG